jgi:uncharacterized protein YaaW (UPF0174 family)
LKGWIKMEQLNLTELSNVNGGGRVAECGMAISAAGGYLAVLGAVTGPIGWGVMAGLTAGAALSGTAMGATCGSLIKNGD